MASVILSLKHVPGTQDMSGAEGHVTRSPWWGFQLSGVLPTQWGWYCDGEVLGDVRAQTIHLSLPPHPEGQGGLCGGNKACAGPEG